jgi:GNAT superfamily N-acetyltransferase
VNWIPRWITTPIRRYVAWSERHVKTQSVTLQLSNLQAWKAKGNLPEEVEIVPLANLGDELLLRRVYNDSAKDSPGFRPARLVDMIAFATAPHHDRHGVFIARCSGHYVGTCVARRRSGGVGMVYSLCVHSEYRRRGVARALLHAALGYLQTRGVDEAGLYAHPENAAAISLYLREGFEVVQLPPPPSGAVAEPRGERRVEREPVNDTQAALRLAPVGTGGAG